MVEKGVLTIRRMSFRQTAFRLISFAECQSAYSFTTNNPEHQNTSPDLGLEFTEVYRSAEVLRRTAYNLVYILSRVTWRFAEFHFAKRHFAEWQHQFPLFLAAHSMKWHLTSSLVQREWGCITATCRPSNCHSPSGEQIFIPWKLKTGLPTLTTRYTAPSRHI